MNRDRRRPLLVYIDPAPRPILRPGLDYCQRPDLFDLSHFLRRTAGQPGHTFTENGRLLHDDDEGAR